METSGDDYEIVTREINGRLETGIRLIFNFNERGKIMYTPDGQNSSIIIWDDGNLRTQMLNCLKSLNLHYLKIDCDLYDEPIGGFKE